MKKTLNQSIVIWFFVTTGSRLFAECCPHFCQAEGQHWGFQGIRKKSMTLVKSRMTKQTFFFKVIRVIGRGNFADVQLARERSTGKVFFQKKNS